MSKNKNLIKKEIEKIREELYVLVGENKEKITNPRVIRKSKKLDKLLNKYRKL